MKSFSLLAWSIGILCIFTVTNCSQSDSVKIQRWMDLVDQYLAQEQRLCKNTGRYRIEKNNASEKPELYFEDLIMALPGPENWKGIKDQFENRMEKVDNSLEQKLENELFLILFSTLTQSTEVQKKSFERLKERIQTAEKEANKQGEAKRDLVYRFNSLVYFLDPLEQALFGESNKNKKDELEEFEMSLKSHEPLNRSDIEKLVGGSQKLKLIDEYMEAVKDWQQVKMVTELQGIDRNLSPEKFEKLKKEYEAFNKKHVEAVSLIEEFMGNKLFKRYYYEESTIEQDEYIPFLQVPSLLKLVDQEKAESLLRRALRLRVTLSIGDYHEHAQKGKTSKLAQRLAKAEAQNLKAPQWKLAQSLNALELYEAMDKMFPEAKKKNLDHENYKDYDREEAKNYYFLNLILNNRETDALLFFKQENYKLEIPYGARKEAIQLGYGKQLLKFWGQLLKTNPVARGWDEYIYLSIELEKVNELLRVADQLKGRTDFRSEKGIETLRNLGEVYLAVGETQKGIDTLLEAAQFPTKKTNPEIAVAKFHVVVDLLKLAELLKEKDLIKQSHSILDKEIEGVLRASSSYEYASLISSIVDVYVQEKNLKKAEGLLNTALETMKRENKEWQKRQVKTLGGDWSPNRTPDKTPRQFPQEYIFQILAKKVEILILQEKYQEVVDLLRDSPDWGIRDLADKSVFSKLSHQESPLGLLTAQAFFHTGNKALSNKILEAQLVETPNLDAVYEFYVKINEEKAIPYLDKLSVIDSFQERPLIWKAQILCDLGKLDEAEKVAQQAIRIDPSDGEQGKGNRMRVYQVMGEIFQKRGDSEKAKFFKEVIQAIRLSERADDFDKAGLKSQAISMYKESLNYFADAYCIQSRLAVQLYREKRYEEAFVHYRKAYELMPDSFGRIESHCFGCESAFDGEEPQQIADEVFSGLLKENPKKPQLHYLMGYLREHQDRYKEAYEYFNQAVQLDPQYINAWKKLKSTANRIKLGDKEREKLSFQIFELDPLSRHSGISFHKIKDFEQLWRCVEGASDRIKMISMPKKLFPLTASASVMEKKASQGNYSSRWEERAITSPQEALLEAPLMEYLERVLVAVNGIGEL